MPSCLLSLCVKAAGLNWEEFPIINAFNRTPPGCLMSAKNFCRMPESYTHDLFS